MCLKLRHREWDMFLPTLQLTINSSYNKTLGDSSFYCLFGYESPSKTLQQPRLNYFEDDLSHCLNRIAHIRNYTRKMLLQNTDKVTKRTNDSRKHADVQIGQEVFAKLQKIKMQRKLDFPISGPFKVVRRIGHALN